MEIFTGPPIPGAPWKSPYIENATPSIQGPVTNNYIQSNFLQPTVGTSTTWNISYKKPVIKGNLLVVVVATQSIQTAIVKDSLGQRYTQAGTYATGSGSLSVWYYENTTSGNNTVTITVPSVDRFCVSVLEYNTASSGNLLDKVTSASITTSTPQPGLNKISRPGELCIAAMFANSASKVVDTVNSPLQLREYFNNSNGIGFHFNVADSVNTLTAFNPTFNVFGTPSGQCISVSFKYNSTQPQAPEIHSGPPNVAAPWFKTPPVIGPSTNIPYNLVNVSATDNLNIVDIVTVVNQLHGTYPPEIVTGPPIPGAPWKSTYVEPTKHVNSPYKIVSDTITITDVGTGVVGIAYEIYAPEITTGPPMVGPRKSTYKERDNNVKSTSVSLVDTIHPADFAQALGNISYAPEITTGPPMPGPRKSLYRERQLQTGGHIASVSDSVVITQSVLLNMVWNASFVDTVTPVAIASGVTLSPKVSDTINVTQSVISNNFYIPSITDSLNITDSASVINLHQYASSNVTITDTAKLFTLHQFVSDTITPTDSTYVHTKFVSVSDTISITQSTHYSPIWMSVYDVITPSQSIITSGSSIRLSLNDTIVVNDYINRLLAPVTVSNTVTITQSAQKLNAPGSQITPIDFVSYSLSKGTNSTLIITDSAVPSVIRSTIPVIDTVAVNHTLAYYLLQATGPTIVTVASVTCRQDKIFAPNGNPPYSAPTIVKANNIVLTYPYASPTNIMVVRNPEFNNQDKKQYRRIRRTSRGGTLLTFRDPQWPKFTRLNYTIRLDKDGEASSMLAFLLQSLGQQIGLLDFESRQWQGIIITPDSSIEYQIRSNGLRVVQFEFEGALV